jgi:hypothetical protein
MHRGFAHCALDPFLEPLEDFGQLKRRQSELQLGVVGVEGLGDELTGDLERLDGEAGEPCGQLGGCGERPASETAATRLDSLVCLPRYATPIRWEVLTERSSGRRLRGNARSSHVAEEKPARPSPHRWLRSQPSASASAKGAGGPRYRRLDPSSLRERCPIASSGSPRPTAA